MGPYSPLNTAKYFGFTYWGVLSFCLKHSDLPYDLLIHSDMMLYERLTNEWSNVKDDMADGVTIADRNGNHE